MRSERESAETTTLGSRPLEVSTWHERRGRVRRRNRRRQGSREWRVGWCSRSRSSAARIVDIVRAAARAADDPARSVLPSPLSRDASANPSLLALSRAPSEDRRDPPGGDALASAWSDRSAVISIEGRSRRQTRRAGLESGARVGFGSDSALVRQKLLPPRNRALSVDSTVAPWTSTLSHSRKSSLRPRSSSTRSSIDVTPSV